jgi:elongation factor 1 alpha-like protein
MAPQTFGDDDFYDPHEDDYDEEQEELSPEDKVAMAEGTEKVKKALGADSAKVTAAQIQEALWHYYYDVDKSVAYLRKSFTPATPKPPPKKSAEGKFHESSFPSTDLSCGGAANGAEAEYHALEQRQCSTSTYNEATPAYPILHKPAVPASMFFSDMPWLDTPRERHANLVAPPPLPGGLLGGSDSAPKMSKLQALAAARKKRTDGKKEKEKASETTEGLENLSISGQTQKENIKPVSAPSAGLKRPNNVLQEPALSEPPSGSSHDKNEAASHTQVHQTPDVPMDNVAVAADQRAAPSAFAQTLVGSAPDAGQKQTRDIFAMPYTSSSSYFAGAFSEPSPDDVVLAAQAKGSNFARTK